MPTYKAFDIVVVPFPFIDRAESKRRPAMVLSSHINFNNKIAHSVMAMITSAKNDPWPQDVLITKLAAGGLSAPSVVRHKLFTLDHRLIVKKIGSLSLADRSTFKNSFQNVFVGFC